MDSDVPPGTGTEIHIVIAGPAAPDGSQPLNANRGGFRDARLQRNENVKSVQLLRRVLRPVLIQELMFNSKVRVQKAKADPEK